MAKKKIDVMKTSTAVKKVPAAKLIIKDNFTEAAKGIGKKMTSSRFKGNVENKSNEPKELSVPQKISFHNVPKNAKRFDKKKKF